MLFYESNDHKDCVFGRKRNKEMQENHFQTPERILRKRPKIGADSEYHIVTPEEAQFDEELSDINSQASLGYSCDEGLSENDESLEQDSCMDEIMEIAPSYGSSNMEKCLSASPFRSIAGRKLIMTDFFRSNRHNSWENASSVDCSEGGQLPFYAHSRRSSNMTDSRRSSTLTDSRRCSTMTDSQAMEVIETMKTDFQCYGCMQNVTFESAPTGVAQVACTHQVTYLINCNYCFKPFCSSRCIRECELCSHSFCNYCTAVQYVGQFERRVCPDCGK